MSQTVQDVDTLHNELGIDEEEPNFIVDCDVLEAAKENIQPLAGGRRATTLAQVLATPHGQRDARLAATKARLRARVEEARTRFEALCMSNGDDNREDEDEDEEDENELEEAEESLLDSYVRLVTWTIEHYPQGHSAESGILELLEEATRVLRDSPLARSDARYLNLWVRYAGYVERPEVIYEYILANEIGTGWAKLYEEYALVLERANRRSKADEMYLLGIARKAEPLDHLQRKQRDFQKRMMVAAPAGEVNPLPEPLDTTSSTSNSSGLRRTVLGESRSTASSSSITSASSSRRTALSPASLHDDVFSGPSASSSLSSSSSRPNGRVAIFVDPSGEAAEAASGNAWPELGTRKERIKENVRAAEKMNGASLKQRGPAKSATRNAASKAKSGAKIVPFRDPEPEPSALKLPPKTPAKGGFVPFVDEPNATQPKAVPATPRFVPFRDETASQTPAPAPGTSLPVPDSVMRPKVVGGTGGHRMSSEAEALRKDPFKNYKDK